MRVVAFAALVVQVVVGFPDRVDRCHFLLLDPRLLN
jgi:hypothetical protein